MQNTIPERPDDVAARVARQTLADRRATYASEVRRLLDAALDLMREAGTTARPRVADIVAAAGLSNDAFYRHFPSKDALVATLLDDGAERLASYLTHQMAKVANPEDRIRCFVEGVLSQADDDIAATTRAVLWNAGTVGQGPASGRHFASGQLAPLLREPLVALESSDPDLDASLLTHATLGMLTDSLWNAERPSRAEIDRIVDFCLAAVTPKRGSATSTKGRRP